MRLPAVERKAHREPHGEALADEPRQAHRAAIGGQDAERRLRQPPFRPVARHDQVAAEGQDAADPDGVAVDRGDDRLREVHEDVERKALPLRQILDELRDRRHCVGVRVLQVGPGGEGAPVLVAGHHHRAHAVIVRPAGKALGNAVIEVLPPGVAGLGAAERHRDDMAVLLGQKGHAGRLLGVCGRCRECHGMSCFVMRGLLGPVRCVMGCHDLHAQGACPVVCPGMGCGYSIRFLGLCVFGMDCPFDSSSFCSSRRPVAGAAGP